MSCTRYPHISKRHPIDDDAIPLPNDEHTPPVTKTYFLWLPVFLGMMVETDFCCTIISYYYNRMNNYYYNRMNDCENQREKMLRVWDKKLMQYEEALKLQETLQKQREDELIEDTILFMEHPHVITLGTRGNETDIIAGASVLTENRVSIAKTNRGGQVTLHSPGQLIGYCIFHLYRRKRALREFISMLEKTLIDALKEFDIDARAGYEDRGIWVDSRKIASIGISVSRGVTMHGFALNVKNDLRAFSWIVPCGIKNTPVTSIEKETHTSAAPDMKCVQDAVLCALAANNQYSKIKPAEQM